MSVGGRRRDLLLEVGCEEIPARMLPKAAADLGNRIVEILDKASLPHGEARVFATPRRLAVLVPEVAPRQDDREEDLTGPPVKAAFGPDGEPTRAALAFADKAGVTLSDLERVTTPRGEYLGARRRLEGRATAEILEDQVPGSVSRMTFPKMMRWGDGARRFVRPVHWLVALLGEEVVPIGIFGVRAGRTSSGHRTLGNRSIEIAIAGEYESALEGEGIVVDRLARREALAGRLGELAAAENLTLVEDTDLLEEVADLVEHPGAVLGTFPESFLHLPREILVTTLRRHQKSFSTERNGRLSNHFLSVCDRREDPQGHIRKGNEWVIVGRLDDARFFFEEDQKTPFEDRRESLKLITFHAAAGSYADKAGRIERIVAELARACAASIEEDVVLTAARLCKCDLGTGLVGEFPELQGIAGGLYIGRSTIPSPLRESVAGAVYDHYRPAGAGDRLPGTTAGSLLALADKLDTLSTLARAVGLPSGSRDPFGLRRAAYGAIRIVAETPLDLSLGKDLVGVASCVAEPGADGKADDRLVDFLFERLQFWLKENRSCRYDTLNAVFLAGDGRRARSEPVPSLVEKALALERLRELPDMAALVEMHKRTRNILDQADRGAGKGKAGAEAREDPTERSAYEGLEEGLRQAGPEVEGFLAENRFEEALGVLVRIRPRLTAFFDHVLVMHPDPARRAERLALVGRLAEFVENVADLKQISISREEMKKSLARLAEAGRPRR